MTHYLFLPCQGLNRNFWYPIILSAVICLVCVCAVKWTSYSRSTQLYPTLDNRRPKCGITVLYKVLEVSDTHGHRDLQLHVWLSSNMRENTKRKDLTSGIASDMYQ